MSVQSEIERIRANIVNAYTALTEKGAEMPAEQNSDNLAETVKTIPESTASDTRFKELLEGKLVTIDDDEITQVKSYTFRNSNNLSTVRMSAVTKINDGAFYQCPKLTSVDMRNLTNLASLVFAGCAALEMISAPALTSISNDCFRGCPLTEMKEFPFVTIGTSSFEETQFVEMSFPELLNGRTNAFKNNTALKKVDFGKITNLENAVFNLNTALESVIIRTPSVCTMASATSFKDCNDTFLIYVPAGLVEEYKVATNWSAYSDRILPIEGSEFE